MSSLADYGIVRLDPDGVINAWSSGAERIKGYKPDEILGQNYAVFFTDEDRAKHLPAALLEDALATRNTHRVGWRVHKDGHRFWGEVSLTALYNDSGQLTGYVKLVRDLSERHAAEETLRRSEELNRLLIDSVVDYATIGLDVNGLIETWNDGAERLKGYSQEEILGHHFSVFYGPEDQAAGVPMGVLNEAKEIGHAERTGWRIRKNGTQFWSDVVVTALRDGDNMLLGYVKVTRDLSERHAAEQAAENATERDKTAAAEMRVHQMRSDFMESISHDLRTPLTAIKGYVCLLRSEKVTEPQERTKFLEQIELGADRLNGMVDELLELAKLESGTTELRLEPVLLQTAAMSAVASLLPVLGRRRVDVQMYSSLRAYADAPALQRIFVNLLGNAAKFTPEESTITIAAEVHDGEVTISVSDNGAGIDDAQKEAIFERFRQGSHMSAKGIGIGLSMVRDYVGLHGGHVWVEDVPGGGARFRFTLPTYESDGPPDKDVDISDASDRTSAQRLENGVIVYVRK